MQEKYKEIKTKYQELEQAIQDSAVLSNAKKYAQVSKEFSEVK